MIRTQLIKALARKYEADIASARATALIYLENSAGIGEHPQHIEELDKLITKIANAEENIKMVQNRIQNVFLTF